MTPIYEQIVEQVKTLIRNEKLKENDNLPSVRSLAKELKISALTVKKAYDNLESEGFTVTVHGKGTYVAATNPELLLEEQKKELEADLEQAIPVSYTHLFRTFIFLKMPANTDPLIPIDIIFLYCTM